MVNYQSFRLKPQDYSLYLIFGLDSFDFTDGINARKMEDNFNKLIERYSTNNTNLTKVIETYYNILKNPYKEKDYRIFGRNANSVQSVNWSIVEGMPLEFKIRSDQQTTTDTTSNSSSSNNSIKKFSIGNDNINDNMDELILINKIIDHGMSHGKSLAFVRTSTGCRTSIEILKLIEYPLILRDYLDQLWIKSRRRFRHLKRKHPELFIDPANKLRY